MIHQALVTIHDEMDPVLVTVAVIGREPIVYRDWRAMYTRPTGLQGSTTDLGKRDFAEWVVIEHLKPEEIIKSEVIKSDDTEFISFVEVIYTSH